jgi:hypothetical protein
MMAHQFDDQRRDVFRQRIGEGGVIGEMDLADTRDLRGGFRHAGDTRTGDQKMDFAELRRGGDDASLIAPFSCSTQTSVFMRLLPSP